MRSITSVQCESQQQRFNNITRDSQHYQLMQSTKEGLSKTARSHIFLLANLWQRLKNKSVSQSTPDIRAVRRNHLV